MLLLAAERTASLASLLGTELDTVATFTGSVNTHTTLWLDPPAAPPLTNKQGSFPIGLKATVVGHQPTTTECFVFNKLKKEVKLALSGSSSLSLLHQQCSGFVSKSGFLA